MFGITPTNACRSLVVFANPAFSEKALSLHDRASAGGQFARLLQDRRDYGGGKLGALLGTEQELEFLVANAPRWKLKERHYRGREATEAQINALEAPYILHLATHGLFLPDVEVDDTGKTLARMQRAKRVSIALHDPMQRSGLAFTGANLTLDAWQRGEVPPTGNDGILTAQEVGSLNLNGTWLVVLSACDTGIGEVDRGEGILGLRRGFVQAGAQNLLMTLWPVSDKWTVEIMKDFYDRVLQTGDAPQALADVQRDWLVRLKKEKGALLAARIAGPFIMTFQGRP